MIKFERKTLVIKEVIINQKGIITLPKKYAGCLVELEIFEKIKNQNIPTPSNSYPKMLKPSPI